jgi:hypothetical protein
LVATAFNIWTRTVIGYASGNPRCGIKFDMTAPARRQFFSSPIALSSASSASRIGVIIVLNSACVMKPFYGSQTPDSPPNFTCVNRRVSKRVKRGLEGLWRKGAAIGLLRPGYKRTPTRPATEHEPAKGPFYDDIDPKWKDVVHETYVKFYRKELPWTVARWLTEQGLPKCGNSTNKEWSDRNAIDLIRRSVYRGVEEYRNTIVRKERESGRHLSVRNEPEEVWTREMPHLRIVEDWLWLGANAAIDERCNHESPPGGAEHPLAGIPRDSRGPLSGLFFCGNCGAKM